MHRASDTLVSIVMDMDESIFERPRCFILGTSNDLMPIDITRVYLPEMACPSAAQNPVASGFDRRLAKKFSEHRKLPLSPTELDVQQRIMEGRMHMVSLIESLGGSTLIAQLFNNIAYTLQSQHGRVTSFAGNEAGSAGASIFFLGAPRYLLASSDVGFHTGYLRSSEKRALDLNEEQRADVKSMQDWVWEDIRSLMQTIPDEDARRQKLLQLDNLEHDASNPEREFSLSAKELLDLGLVTEVLPSVASMVSCFEEESGISVQSRGKEDPISRFFCMQEIQESMFALIGKHIHFSFSKGSLRVRERP